MLVSDHLQRMILKNGTRIQTTSVTLSNMPFLLPTPTAIFTLKKKRKKKKERKRKTNKKK
jgi:hypothetical protein